MAIIICEIDRQVGKKVTLFGWLHSRRSSGKIHFLTLRDGTGIIQAVMSKSTVDVDTFINTNHLGHETSVIVEGVVRKDSRAPSGYELDVSQLDVVGKSHNYPITPKEHGVDYLLDRRHLWIRSQRQVSILRIRHEELMPFVISLTAATLFWRILQSLHLLRARGQQPYFLFNTSMTEQHS